MTPEQTRSNLESLNKQAGIIQEQISQLENDYALATCPWPKDTIIRYGQRLFIVDEIFYALNSWAVRVTKINKDLKFSQRTETIFAMTSNAYKVVAGLVVSEYCLIPAHKAGFKEVQP
jgi:hypothetical protein